MAWHRCRCAGGQQNDVFRMHLEKYLYVDVGISASMLCRREDALVGKMEKMLHLLLHTSLMCLCQHVGKYCYAKVEMRRWQKWKSCRTNCPFIHDFCADAGMSGNYEVLTWRRAGGKNINEYMPAEIYIVCRWWHVGDYFMLAWRHAGVKEMNIVKMF